MLLEIGFDAADNHIRQLGHGVQDFFIDGYALRHQHLRANPAGECGATTDAAGSGPSSRESNEGDDPIVGIRGAAFDRHVAFPELDSEHGSEHIRASMRDALYDYLVQVHSGNAGSRIPASFSFI